MPLYCKKCSDLETGELIYHRPFGGDCIVNDSCSWDTTTLPIWKNEDPIEEIQPKMKYCPYCGNRLPSEK